MVNDAGKDTHNFEGWRLMTNIKIHRTFSWWLSDILVNTVIGLAYSGQYRRQCHILRSYMKQIMLAIHASFVSCHLDPSIKRYRQSKFGFWQLKWYTKFDRNLTVRHVYRLYLWNNMNIWNRKIDPNLLTVNYAAKILCQLQVIAASPWCYLHWTTHRNSLCHTISYLIASEMIIPRSVYQTWLNFL